VSFSPIAAQLPDKISHLLVMRFKSLLFSCLSLTLLCLTSFAQTWISSEGKRVYETRGRVADRDRVPIPEARLNIQGTEIERSADTDQDGFFRVTLPPGKFEVSSEEANAVKFKAFIQIIENGLNPTDFELTMETDQTSWCLFCPDGKIPGVTKYVSPGYPQTAEAIGAIGKVAVEIVINKQGNVAKAKRISGHPILKAACEKAAEQWTFSPNENVPERRGIIVFNFVSSPREKTESRFRRPNVMDILMGGSILVTSTTDIMKK
jgi:TonB family protein